MELKEARYILSIARNKSITKAAKELYISQPSLSKYLKNLEDRLDIKLFSRIGSQYIPTHLGERYLHYAQQIIALSEEWNHEYKDAKRINSGNIKIAMPIMRSTCLLPKTLPQFHNMYPNVKISLLEDVYFVAEHTFHDNTIDMILFNKESFPETLDCEILGQEEIVLIVSKNHPLAGKGIKKQGLKYPWIDLSLFSQEPFILLFPDQNTGSIALELFEAYQISPPVLFHTRNSQASIELALEGMGITFAPESYYHHVDYQKKGFCFSVGNPVTKSTLILGHQKGRYLPSYAKAYVNIVKEYLSKLNASEGWPR